MDRWHLRVCLISAMTATALVVSAGSSAAGRDCSITAIKRWRVNAHTWTFGGKGGNFTVDFVKQQTSAGTPIRVTPKPNGVEFSFDHVDDKGRGRVVTYDMTARNDDDGCKMVGGATIMPGRGTADAVMRPR